MKLWLIGFMGSGKSSLGKQLARTLNLSFYDTDSIIEKRAALRIDQIFRKHGESYFRILERQLCLEYSNFSSGVYATGGGTPIKSFSVDEMMESGQVVFLNAPLEVLWDRVSKDKNNRPLAISYDQFASLHECRYPIYKRAQYVINSVQSMESCMKELQGFLSKTI